MDRKQLLAIVYEELSVDAATSLAAAERALTAVTERLAHAQPKVASDQRLASLQRVTAEDLASFLDGTLSPADESHIVEYLASDRELLLEVIFFVQHRKVPNDEMKISAPAKSRLLEMALGNSLSTSPPQIHPDVASIRSPLKRSMRKLWPILAIAASVVVLLNLWLARSNESQRFVNTNSSNSTQTRSSDNGAESYDLPSNALDSPTERTLADGQLNETPPAESFPEDGDDWLEELANLTEVSENREVAEADGVADLESDSAEKKLADESSTPIPSSPDARPASFLAGLTWQQVTGLLAVEQPTKLGDYSNQAWRGLAVGGATNLGKPFVSEAVQAIHFVSMPGSRAKAISESGTELIVSPDSGVVLRQNGTDQSLDLDLEYGAVALLSIPEGASLQLRAGGRYYGVLNFEEVTDVAIGFTAKGLQALVSKGRLEIDGQRIARRGIQWNWDNSTVKVPVPRRQPAWMEQNAKPFGLPEEVLAQFASSPNLNRAFAQFMLDSQANNIPRSRQLSQELSIVAAWQARLAGDQLLRLVGSRNEMSRSAALQFLMEIPEWEPRYPGIWNGLQKASLNDRGTQQLKTIFTSLRQRAALSIEQQIFLSRSLESPSLALRAISDYVLRVAYGGGPTFDPTWTGQELSRGARLWRSQAKLPSFN